MYFSKNEYSCGDAASATILRCILHLRIHQKKVSFVQNKVKSIYIVWVARLLIISIGIKFNNFNEDTIMQTQNWLDLNIRFLAVIFLLLALEIKFGL